MTRLFKHRIQLRSISQHNLANNKSLDNRHWQNPCVATRSDSNQISTCPTPILLIHPHGRRTNQKNRISQTARQRILVVAKPLHHGDTHVDTDQCRCILATQERHPMKTEEPIDLNESSTSPSGCES